MYHPEITFAVAQTRHDDLRRDLHRARPQAPATRQPRAGSAPQDAEVPEARMHRAASPG